MRHNQPERVKKKKVDNHWTNTLLGPILVMASFGNFYQLLAKFCTKVNNNKSFFIALFLRLKSRQNELARSVAS